MSAATAELAPASSTAARSAVRNLIFEALCDVLDLVESYAISGREAAYRGDEITIGVHIRQIRACTIELIKLRNDLGAQSEKVGDA
jgi:hypothetical protein